MTVFYRKYRPQKLADLVGQEGVTKILLEQLKNGKVGHGYLFWGQRGTGKTSTARIFAKAVNCEIWGDKKRDLEFGEPCNKCESCISITNGSNLDILEIDAASNRGIDEIRDLREKVKLSPVSVRFKVYIIDEVHMLTNEAFNALLKTLEEPPEHVIFILATTEISKLPQTILSRLQKFHFKKASDDDISSVVERVAKAEKIKIDKDAVLAIADAAEGSFRDAVSVLDQASVNEGVISASDVWKISKTTTSTQIYELLGYFAKKDLKSSLKLIEKMADDGFDFSNFSKNVAVALERVLYAKVGLGLEMFADLELDEKEKINSLSSKFSTDEVQSLIRQVLSTEADIKLFPLAHIPLVLVACKFCGVVEDDLSVMPNTESKEHFDEKKADVKQEKIKELVKVVSEESPILKNKSGSKGAKSISEVEKNWGEFLNKVRPVNAHVVALLRSTKPVDFDGDNLTLEVFYRFHKDKLEEPKIVSMLDEKITEVMNTPLRLRFVLAKRESKPTREVDVSDVVDIKAEDLEKIAQEIFSK